ncbi:PKD domain-containing protein [Bacillus sp. SM2101]|uniref:PKD domain-containing protein n=1 Tax=Bacillus sp. SM2101 TaxID=2805366 RepID=UPI001BDF33F8|nr:PKD domain-containing protein [Bacillus sp. SM2101]
MGMIPKEVNADYPSTEAEFYDYVRNVYIDDYNINDRRADYWVYTTYNKVVYKTDNYGRTSSNSKCGNSRENEYLGEDYNGEKIYNYCFPNDAQGSNPENWDYLIVDSLGVSWENLSSSQENHILSSKLEGHGATNLTISSLGGKKYGKVSLAPTWRSEGNIFTQNNAGGRTWYADFVVPPLSSRPVLEGDITTDKTEYKIAAGEDDVTVNYTAKATSDGEGLHFRHADIRSLKAGFNFEKHIDQLGSSDYVTTSGSKFSTKDGSFKLTRDMYSVGTHTINLEADFRIEAIWGEKDQTRANTTITLVVEPDTERYTTTTVSVDPSTVRFEDKDVKVKVTVHGQLHGISDSNRIKGWEFLVREEEVTTPKVKTNSDKSFTSQTTFDFTIPKNRIVDGMVDNQFIQNYVGRARVTLIDNSVPDNSSDEANTFITDGDIPDIDGPNADFTWTPSDDLKQGDTVTLIEACTHPNDVEIVEWNWSVGGNDRTTRMTLENYGSNTAKLTCTDANGKSDTVTKIIEAGKPGTPPVASFFIEEEYFWIEEVVPQNNSYDIDGEIVSSDWTLDSGRTSIPLTFTRVTEPELHRLGLTVTDNDGETDFEQQDFRVLPTTPTADFQIYSFDRDNNQINDAGKENRTIVVDATLSDAASPSSDLIPIDYSRTTYDIRPVTSGIDPAGIMIRQNSDRSNLEFLVREAGEYEITVTVTNELNETSKPVTKKVIVDPDEKPIAQFTVDKKKYLRDGTTKKATITLTDNSLSMDDDYIKQRIWSVEFDSNNDGVFGTRYDTPKEILSNENKENITYETDKVGNYRFSLDVVEGFGQQSLYEFIQDEHYRTDLTEPINPQGNIEDYLLDENFNIPESDVAIEVDNAPPTVDFGVQRHSVVDVTINFSGVDTATRQHQTGRVSGGGNYDHYFFTYDTTEKNKLTSIAANLEVDLITKGINSDITIDNSYYQVADSDGVCRRDVPVWGWTRWTTYDYNTVTTTNSSYRPPSGWSITSSSSRDFYDERTETRQTSGGRPSGSGWSFLDGGIDSETGREWARWERTVREYSHTEYTYRLKKTVHHEVYEIQRYTDYGCNSTEQVDTTDFTQSFTNASYRADADRYYLHFDKRDWAWTNSSSKVTNFRNKMRNDDIYFWDFGPNSLRSTVDTNIANGSTKGQFDVYDSTALEKQIQDIKDYMINKYLLVADGEYYTILLGDQLDYTVTYEDHENDPELKREWKFTHDNTSVNGRVIDNQPSEPIAQSGLWINNPMQLPAVGTYSIELRAMDDPIWWGDDRFFNYRKWSDEEIVREYKVSVHRPPIAEFNFTLDSSNRLTLDSSPSYDPEHEFNRPDRGIVEYNWSYYLDGIQYNGQPPTNLVSEKYYDVTLQVKDIDGAYGSITKRISTKSGNLKPVAKFNVQEVVYRSQELDFEDLSYDPDGDPLTDYRITVRQQGNSTILKTLSSFPTSFADMNLSEGTYVIGLTVRDIPTSGSSLQSDLFEKSIQVINDNNPPVSIFTLSPNPVEKGTYLTYSDSSYDPDGHPLINYSWEIELLDENQNTIDSWITGAVPTDLRDFAGIGTYRITQTVFDDPPFPLPSLSGSSSIIVEMIQGLEAPFAEFSWQPQGLVVGDTFTLDPTFSYDLDGEVIGYQWTILAPNGLRTTSTERFPKVINALEGEYDVSLHVTDNDGLRSQVPAEHTIKVGPLPPNLPPVANFNWEPFTPFLGEQIRFNPDSSYDIDGEIVSWSWTLTGSDGSIQTSNEEYPSITGDTEYYTVNLEVTDDRGGKGSVTKVVNVDIAKLTPLVTHADGWKEVWVSQGFDENVNTFYAGEKFIIELTSTPAAYVWGSVNFGGDIGKVDIPKEQFTLVSTSTYEYTWIAELWQENFERIEDGEYLFQFHAMHPEISAHVQSDANYLIEIIGNIYEALKFHRNY